jgi:SAM-dependent methyltransferase
MSEQGGFDAVTEDVRAHYAEAARAILAGSTRPAEEATNCCAADAPTGAGAIHYDEADLTDLPEAAVLASLGCGNPMVVAALRPGETVLDLGSGGGIDVLLSAQRVGPTGFAYGIDMTDEMLELARRNAAAAGAANVEFRKGRMEAIPLPDASVDVVISNCVVNLSTDKAAVLGEIARVLRSGGRLGISDIVADDALTPAQRAERGNVAGCIAGALSFTEYRAGLEAVGLEQIEITATHPAADGLHSAIVGAVKPADWTPERVRPVDLPRPAAGLPVMEGSGCCGGTGCC